MNNEVPGSGGVSTSEGEIIFNEISKIGQDLIEWYELLVTKRIDLRESLMATTNGTLFSFTTNALWASVEAGTFIVIHDGSNADPDFPQDDEDKSDGKIIVSVTNTDLFENVSWEYLPPESTTNELNFASLILSNASLGMLSAVTINYEEVLITNLTSVVYQTYSPRLSNLSEGETFQFIGSTSEENINSTYWKLISASNSTPGEANSSDNLLFLSNIRGKNHSVIINEYSQGTSNAHEWVELLTLNETSLRGLKLKNSDGVELVFQDNSNWDDIPAGTLIVIYNGIYKDETLPPDDSNPDDYTLVLKSTSVPHFDPNSLWPSINDASPGSLRLETSSGYAIHGISFNGDTRFSLQMVLSNVTGQASYALNSSLVEDAALLAGWIQQPAAMGVVTPTDGNSFYNQALLDSLRQETTDTPFKILSPVNIGNNSWHGNIAELLILDGKISDGKRAHYTRYFKNKYNLSLNTSDDELCLMEHFGDSWDISYLDLNHDDDLLLTGLECDYGTDPELYDTDGDLIPDHIEVWVLCSNPLEQDSDGDGLLDGEEYLTYFTDPNFADTDNDGLTDFEEINDVGSSPTNSDWDADGLLDSWEYKVGLNPNKYDAFDPTLVSSQACNDAMNMQGLPPKGVPYANYKICCNLDG